MEVESNSRRWESEAKEASKQEFRADAERDVARHEVVMARLETEASGSARAQVESELARVQRALVALEDAQRKVESELVGAQQALAASGEAWRKTKKEANRLTDERVSLLLELEAIKDKLSAFREEASKEKKAFGGGF